MGWKNKNSDEEVPVPSEQEEIKESSKKVKEEFFEAVVPELPKVSTRNIRGEDGKLYSLVTSDEALQEILAGVRELLKRTDD